MHKYQLRDSTWWPGRVVARQVTSSPMVISDSTSGCSSSSMPASGLTQGLTSSRPATVAPAARSCTAAGAGASRPAARPAGHAGRAAACCWRHCASRRACSAWLALIGRLFQRLAQTVAQPAVGVGGRRGVGRSWCWLALRCWRRAALAQCNSWCAALASSSSAGDGGHVGVGIGPWQGHAAGAGSGAPWPPPAPPC